MRVILNGAGGHMGTKVIEAIEKTEDCELVAGIDAMSEDPAVMKSLADYQGPADVIIDFSHHSVTNALCDYAVERQIPVVIATTGQTPEEAAYIEQASKKVAIFKAGNFSLGIAVLMQLTREAVRMFPNADIEIVEQHHNRKLDVPSGTALMLGQAVQEARPEATLLVGRHENGKRTKDEVGIHSLRMGNVVGIHEVIINTGTQTISLKHEAHDRALFADGALSAAEFMVGKAPGLYDMKDLLAG